MSRLMVVARRGAAPDVPVGDLADGSGHVRAPPVRSIGGSSVWEYCLHSFAILVKAWQI